MKFAFFSILDPGKMPLGPKQNAFGMDGDSRLTLGVNVSVNGCCCSVISSKGSWDRLIIFKQSMIDVYCS